jgi:large subunit ribosomal protein L24
MKTFSSSWIKSKKPKKQRKYRLNAPKSIKRKMISSHLSKELKQKYQKRSFPLRTGDVVKVVRGRFDKKEGKIERIDSKKAKIYVSGCEAVRVNGQKSKVAIDPSNVIIIDLKLDDKKRKEALERKQKKD